MPLRSVLLLLCCQNPRMENDLETLSNFIKAMRDSVEGMRTSMVNIHSSTAEFHKSMGMKVNKPQQKVNFPTYDEKKSVYTDEEYTNQTSVETESTLSDITEWKDTQNNKEEK